MAAHPDPVNRTAAHKQAGLAPPLGVHDQTDVNGQCKKPCPEINPGQRLPAMNEKNIPVPVAPHSGDGMFWPPGIPLMSL